MAAGFILLFIITFGSRYSLVPLVTVPNCKHNIPMTIGYCVEYWESMTSGGNA